MNTTSQSINSSNWEETIKDSGFSLPEIERYMNESYQSGYNDKGTEIKERLQQLFSSNGNLTNDITNNVITFLKQKLGIMPVSAFMKIETIFSFSVIFTVDLKDYISDSILKAYEFTGDIEKKYRTDNYNIDISFMNEDESLNIRCLNSDGFRFKHKTLSEK